jgi:hypothetical protein
MYIYSYGEQERDGTGGAGTGGGSGLEVVAVRGTVRTCAGVGGGSVGPGGCTSRQITLYSSRGICGLK